MSCQSFLCGLARLSWALHAFVSAISREIIIFFYSVYVSLHVILSHDNSLMSCYFAVKCTTLYIIININSIVKKSAHSVWILSELRNILWLAYRF